jgi:large subunit ribosomal protein L23
MNTSIIQKPLITEKMSKTSEKLGQYGFVVAKSASKDEIKAAIEKLYEVHITNISTMVYAGKSKSRFTKKGNFSGRKPAFKKAIVKLKEGQTIDFYKNI